MEMTWKEFKEKIKEAGVIDEMKIDYIDFAPHRSDEIIISINKERNEFDIIN